MRDPSTKKPVNSAAPALPLPPGYNKVPLEIDAEEETMDFKNRS